MRGELQRGGAGGRAVVSQENGSKSHGGRGGMSYCLSAFHVPVRDPGFLNSGEPVPS